MKQPPIKDRAVPIIFSDKQSIRTALELQAFNEGKSFSEFMQEKVRKILKGKTK